MGWGTLLLLTLGGALIFEGFGWAVAPDAMKRAYAEAIEMMSNRQLSTFGLISLAVGLVMIVLGVGLVS